MAQPDAKPRDPAEPSSGRSNDGYCSPSTGQTNGKDPAETSRNQTGCVKKAGGR